MQIKLKTKQLTGQERIISTYGDAFWEWLCDEFTEEFTTRQAANFPQWKHMAERTKFDYARVILKNVEAGQEVEDRPFVRRGRLFVWQTPNYNSVQ